MLGSGTCCLRIALKLRRNTRRRKAVEPRIKRLGQRGNAFSLL